MKTLEEHNEERMKLYNFSSKQQANGIECPECDHELVDVRPGEVLTSFPPKVEIRCPACKYHGYRIE